ncbi:MAG: hypothetical protein KBD07_02470 [Candidatus Omnitrophica bacterium]|nr:hypothetical protein [Candidatus Omnitrophota bacterium]
MTADAGSGASVPQGEFNLDEVIRLKGHHFKIVLIDGYTGKIAMKWITPEEAAILEAAGSGPLAGSFVNRSGATGARGR